MQTTTLISNSNTSTSETITMHPTSISTSSQPAAPSSVTTTPPISVVVTTTTAPSVPVTVPPNIVQAPLS